MKIQRHTSLSAQQTSERPWKSSSFRIAALLIALIWGPVSIAAGAANTLTCSAAVPTVPRSSPSTSTAVGGAASSPPPALGSGNALATKDEGKLATDPSQFDLRVFSGTDSAIISIRNDTSNEISELDMSSLGLIDGKTGRHVSFESRRAVNLGLEPHYRTDCTFALPSIDYAGTYTGSLRVQEAVIPITLRVRGPFVAYWNGFPLALLTAVFLIGWSASLLLNSWYTTGLPRAQQVLLLREQQTAISNFLTELGSWEKQYGSGLPKTTTATAFDKSDLDTLLTQADSVSLLELQQDEQRFALACHLNEEFWTALRVAGAKVPAQALPAVVAQMDGLVRSADPASYRAALLQVLTSPLPAGAAIAPGQTAACTLGVDLTNATAATLRGKIRSMDFVKASVLGIATWITAFSVYYYPNPSFGGILDYLTVFVWALGLTTTGSQLISSIRKP